MIRCCCVLIWLLASAAWAGPRPIQITTADGVTLQGRRHATPEAQPVILLHGLGTNLYSLDLPGRSLAAHLASRRFDVWLVSLRRSGSFDDLALRDVPAVIAHVRRVTQKRPLLIGHSMGGLVLYAHLQGAHWVRTRYGMRVGGSARLARQRQAAVRGLVTICTPPRLQWRRGKRSPLLGGLARSWLVRAWLRRIERVPLDQLSRLVGPRLSTRAMEASGLLFEAGKVDGRTRLAFVRWAAGSIDSRLARQFLDGVRHQTFREYHRSDRARPPYVYSDHLDRIRLPTLVISATRDRLVDHTIVRRHGYLVLGSKDRTYFAARGYGHMDLIVGRDAKREVYPVIDRWLVRHRGGD